MGTDKFSLWEGSRYLDVKPEGHPHQYSVTGCKKFGQSAEKALDYGCCLLPMYIQGAPWCKLYPWYLCRYQGTPSRGPLGIQVVTPRCTYLERERYPLIINMFP